MRYSVVIHKDSGSDYGVTVPDLPGCFTVGETIEDALTQAAEAIECHIEGLLLDGDSIPEAKNIHVHQENSDYADGEWKSVAINLKNLTDSVQERNSSSLFQQIINSFSTPRLLPYAAGLLVLIVGSFYLGNRYGNRYFDERGPGTDDIARENAVVPPQVVPTFVKGVGKDLKISPFGFGAFPKIPTDFPDQNIWNVVEKRSVHDSDGAKTLELLARVRIKLWEQGKHTKGVIMDPSTGLVYSDSGIKILPDLRTSASADSDSGQPQYNMYFDDELSQQGRISVEFLEGGIDPYKFLNLRR